MVLIEEAISIALDAHKEQTDLSGKPYILHPIRVMAQAKTENGQIVAILHDVVEDSDIDLEFLGRRFCKEVIDALDAITKRTGEPYSEYLDRVSENSLATQVKLWDVTDNLRDVESNIAMSALHVQRQDKYLAAYNKLRMVPNCE